MPAVLKKLAALKPNQAVLLGKADVVGVFNGTAKKYDLHRTGPKGCDFTIKMCWAPDRKRGLFCGANHGVPHRLNDVWEFDLPSLSWAMLYAPDNPPSGTATWARTPPTASSRTASSSRSGAGRR
ncbi:hypothetical protein [Gemmata sp.]|uniref:hypothetical protein n=1 Tax=Gemmata sp. TaxID=1914242 RepID=UPI003F701DF9